MMYEFDINLKVRFDDLGNVFIDKDNNDIFKLVEIEKERVKYKKDLERAKALLKTLENEHGYSTVIPIEELYTDTIDNFNKIF